MDNELSDNSVRRMRDTFLYFRTEDEINNNDKNKFESKFWNFFFDLLTRAP